MLRGYSTIIYLFLYAPIALIVLFSFNSGNNASDFQHFALTWYGKAANNTFVIEALENSLIIAAATTVASSVLGTMAAWLLYRYRFPFAQLVRALIYFPMIVPEVISEPLSA